MMFNIADCLICSKVHHYLNFPQLVTALPFLTCLCYLNSEEKYQQSHKLLLQSSLVLTLQPLRTMHIYSQGFECMFYYLKRNTDQASLKPLASLIDATEDISASEIFLKALCIE